MRTEESSSQPARSTVSFEFRDGRLDLAVVGQVAGPHVPLRGGVDGQVEPIGRRPAPVR